MLSLKCAESSKVTILGKDVNNIFTEDGYFARFSTFQYCNYCSQEVQLFYLKRPTRYSANFLLSNTKTFCCTHSWILVKVNCMPTQKAEVIWPWILTTECTQLFWECSHGTWWKIGRVLQHFNCLVHNLFLRGRQFWVTVFRTISPEKWIIKKEKEQNM